MVNSARKSDNVVFLGQSEQPSQSQTMEQADAAEFGGVTGQLISHCRKVAARAFPSMLHELFDALDDDLYKLAENSTSNTAQTTYFDAMRSLRVFRPGLEKAYVANLLANYDEFWRSGGQNTLIRSPREEQADQGLSLIGEEELEEDLATSSMIAKANSRYHRNLFALNKRFTELLGARRVTDGQNPLGPSVVASEFRQELAAWDGEILVRIVIYKLFDKHVMSRLKPVYEEINQHLMAAGILPDLHNPQQHSTATSHQGAPAHTAEAVAPRSPQGAPTFLQQDESQQVPGVAELWGYMQQIMDTRQRSDLGLLSSRVAQANNLPEMPRSALVDELSALQQQVLAAPVLRGADTEAVQQHLREELVRRLITAQDSTSVHQLGKNDQQTIDVILMLFNQVLDDPNLPDAMRAMLARLQIPVLKAAIADVSFIENKSHPARLLLNNLAKASVGWSEQNDRSEDSLYGKVKGAVDRILHEFDADVSLFTAVNEEFTSYMDRSTRITAATEKRVAQTLEGEDRLQSSRDKVDAVLQRYPRERMPEIAIRLLDDPWKKLLTIILLREGEESKRWRDAVAVADELVKSVLPGNMGVSRKELLSIIPKLGSKLRAGFTSISFNPGAGRKMLNELQTCHIDVIRSKKSRDTDVQARGAAFPPVSEREGEPPRPEPIAAEIPPVAQPVKVESNQQPQEDEHDQLAAAIDEGQWVKMHFNDKDIVGKLVWRSKHTGTMLFVDGQGRKVAQINQKKLAGLFRTGAGNRLEDPETPIMDRAFGRMMRILQAKVVGPKLEI